MYVYAYILIYMYIEMKTYWLLRNISVCMYCMYIYVFIRMYTYVNICMYMYLYICIETRHRWLFRKNGTSRI